MFRTSLLLLASALASFTLSSCSSTSTAAGTFLGDRDVSAQGGLIVTDSSQAYSDTISALDAAIRGKGLRLFSRVSHSEGARGVGLDLGPTELFIFGNPNVGTLLMQASRTVGLDLPQRMLVWQDESGVHIAHNDPAWLGVRHGFEHPALAKISGLLAGLASTAAGN